MDGIERNIVWLAQSLSEGPTPYSQIIRDDIAVSLDIENLSVTNLRTFLGAKFEDFIDCRTRLDVDGFVDGIVSFVVMKSDHEELIQEYLGS